MTKSYSRYDWARSYQWNFEHPPNPLDTGDLPATATPGSWRFCGLEASSPLGIPAGPLLNGKWLVHYAQLGFDVLTYKTVRSRHRESYPVPNLKPIREDQVKTGQVVQATDAMQGSWAISFGMPSMSPDVWRQDLEWTRNQLRPEKILVVSVVATPEPGWTMDDVAADYARCAGWAVESGADCVELNFSCPNVASVDGQLYQDPRSARLVLQTVRENIGEKPLVIKIGVVEREEVAAALLDASREYIQAISMTNCLACKVRSNDQYLFEGELRGIGGAAIRKASLNQVKLFARIIDQQSLPISVVGVGGIFSAAHVQEYLMAGAESTQIATAAMLQPGLALEIKRELELSIR